MPASAAAVAIAPSPRLRAPRMAMWLSQENVIAQSESRSKTQSTVTSAMPSWSESLLLLEISRSWSFKGASSAHRRECAGGLSFLLIYRSGCGWGRIWTR